MIERNPVPAARRDRLVVEQLADETLIYDLDRHLAHSLNQSAAIVWNACDGTRTIADLAALLPGELSAGDKEAAVRVALGQLREAQLLTGAMKAEKQEVSASRRALLVKIGISAAIATIPLITSIGVPPAHAQASPVDGILVGF
jgi:hypothetical protein